MQIRWSPEAADELERIVQHIQKDNPEAARTVAETIYEGASSLMTFPNRGRIGRHRGSRELIFEPYILVYRVSGEFVEISRVYHAAQDRPSE
jgi:addiction module RelE/StbE family toxin